MKINPKEKVTARHPVIYVSMTQDGYHALGTLLASGKRIDLIITLPKEKAGGVSDYEDFRPLGKKYRIPIRYSANVNKLASQFRKLHPAVIFVNGWSQLLNAEILKIPLYGCVGTHPSLLPKNRGRAPIAWHFLNKERMGGISLFYLDEGCDSGPIIDQKSFSIGPNDNAGTYYKKITRLGSELLLKHYDKIVIGKAAGKPQRHSEATYLLKRRPRDSFLDFTKSAVELKNAIRAVSDIYPLAFFFYKRKMYRVLSGSVRKVARYSGLPGQIAVVSELELQVLTSNGIVTLTGIKDRNKRPISLKTTFHEGEILNEK